MNLDDKLATAFATWSDARAQLGTLRAQTASGPAGKQLAPSPEAVALFDTIRDQEAVCMRLWHDLATVAEERAVALELTRTTEIQARAETRLSDSLRRDAHGASAPSVVNDPDTPPPGQEQP